jgi:hypothetical protein
VAQHGVSVVTRNVTHQHHLQAAAFDLRHNPPLSGSGHPNAQASCNNTPVRFCSEHEIFDFDNARTASGG